MIERVARWLGVSMTVPPLTSPADQRAAERIAWDQQQRIAHLDAWTDLLARRAGELEQDVRDRLGP